MNTPLTPIDPEAVAPRRRGPRIAAVLAAGTMAGLIAVGGGVLPATAQDDADTGEPTESVATAEAVGDDGFVVALDADDVELSDADHAVLDRFDACLDDAGLGPDVDEDALDEAVIDAAFDACDPILDELSDELRLIEEFELSPEDEALFDEFDQCLSDAGFDVEGDGDIADLDDAAVDAAFETCESILEDLSDAVFIDELDGDVFDEISPEDEALFERFDECLADAGVVFDEGEADAVDTDDIDDTDENSGVVVESFELDEDALIACEAILEDLSDDGAFSVFEEGCDDHDDDEADDEEADDDEEDEEGADD